MAEQLRVQMIENEMPTLRLQDFWCSPPHCHPGFPCLEYRNRHLLLFKSSFPAFADFLIGLAIMCGSELLFTNWLDELGGLFQSDWVYDSMILRFLLCLQPWLAVAGDVLSPNSCRCFNLIFSITGQLDLSCYRGDFSYWNTWAASLGLFECLLISGERCKGEVFKWKPPKG